MGKRLAANFSNEDFRKIEAYCRRKGLSWYALIKEAVGEYMAKHSYDRLLGAFPSILGALGGLTDANRKFSILAHR